MNRIIIALLALASAALGLGCSLVTNFDPDKIPDDAGTDTSRYSLSGAVDDPVNVTLTPVDTYEVGEMEFALKKELPGEPETLKEMLIDGTVGLILTKSDGTGVSADLLGGVPAEKMPAAPGEYWVEIESAKNFVTIHFYNGWDDSGTIRTIQAGTDYEAAISVLDNADYPYFAVEEFTRHVSVTSVP
jgi:hypothetical protein